MPLAVNKSTYNLIFLFPLEYPLKALKNQQQHRMTIQLRKLPARYHKQGIPQIMF